MAQDLLQAFREVWKQTEADAPQVRPPKTAATAWEETPWQKFVPFLGTAYEVAELTEILGALKALERGDAAPEHLQLLLKVASDVEEDAARQTTLGYDVSSTLLQLPAFLGEFAAGLHGAGVMARAIPQGLREAVEAAIRQGGAAGLRARLTRGAAKTVGTLATMEAVGQASTGASRIEATGRQRQLRPFGMEDAGDAIEFFLDEQIPSFASQFPAALLDETIEVATELSGAALGRGLARVGGALGGARIMQRRIFQHAAEKWGAAEAAARIGRFGWDGPIQEYLEEVAGWVAREGLGLDGGEFPGVAEFLAFTIAGAGFAGAGAGIQAMRPPGGPGSAQAGFELEMGEEADQEEIVDPESAEEVPSAKGRALLRSLRLEGQAEQAFPDHEVVEAPTKEARKLQEEARTEFGVDLLFFGGAERGPARAAHLGPGVVGVRTEDLEAEGPRLWVHELVHELSRRGDGGRALFRQLAALDAEAMGRAMEAAEAGRPELGEAGEAEMEEEAAAIRAEALAGRVLELLQSPQEMQAVAEKAPKLFARIKAWLSKLWARWLGQPTPAELRDAAQNVEAQARAVVQAFREMQRRVAPSLGLRAPQGSPIELLSARQKPKERPEPEARPSPLSRKPVPKGPEKQGPAGYPPDYGLTYWPHATWREEKKRRSRLRRAKGLREQGHAEGARRMEAETPKPRLRVRGEMLARKLGEQRRPLSSAQESIIAEWEAGRVAEQHATRGRRAVERPAEQQPEEELDWRQELAELGEGVEAWPAEIEEEAEPERTEEVPEPEEPEEPKTKPAARKRRTRKAKAPAEEEQEEAPAEMPLGEALRALEVREEAQVVPPPYEGGPAPVEQAEGRVEQYQAGPSGASGTLELTTTKTAITDAVSRGSRITVEDAEAIAEAIGEDTLNATLDSPPRRDAILKTLVRAGSIAKGELEVLLDADGNLNAVGREVVKQTVLGAVLPDVTAIRMAPSSVVAKLLRALPSLIALRADYHLLGRDLADAVEFLHSAKKIKGASSYRGDELTYALSRNPESIPEPWRTNTMGQTWARALRDVGQMRLAKTLADVTADFRDRSAGQQHLYEGPKDFKPALELVAEALAEHRPETWKADGPRFAAAARARQEYDVAPETSIGLIRRLIENKYLRVEQTEQKLRGGPGLVTASIRRHPGKTADRIARFEELELKPLLEHIAKHDLDRDALDLYAYAKHAPERNAKIAERRPVKFGDTEATPGSGMSDSEAKKIVRETEAGPKGDAYKKAHAMVRAMLERSLDETVADGLLSAEQRDLFRETYSNYVPLRTDDGRQLQYRKGRGFQISGAEHKRAKGRRSKADSPVIFALVQREAGIVRGEANLVGQAAGALFLRHKNPQQWVVKRLRKRGEAKDGTLTDAEKRGVLVDKDGDLISHPRELMPENVFAFKRRGDEYRIRFADPLIPRALRNLGADSVGGFTALVRALTRHVARMNTSWSPEFLATNFGRDLQEALVHMGGENGLDTMKQVMAKALPAMRAAYRVERDYKAPGKLEDHYREMRAMGGAIAYFGSRSFGDMEKQAERIVEDFKKGPRKGLRSMADWIERSNLAFENATRLAVYSTLREKGVPAPKAALYSRDVTVDFQRGGEWTSSIGSWFMFFNAGLQSSFRVMRSLKNFKRTRQIVGAIIATAALSDIINRAIGGDDDDGVLYYDKIPQHTKERNWIFMIPGSGGKHLKLPLPWGYNLFHNLGRGLVEAAFGVRDPLEVAGRTVAVAFDSYNPMGTAPTALQFFAPTIVDPLAQVAENVAWYGGPIMPERNIFEPETPDAYRHFSSASEPAQHIARALNYATGGNKVEPGFFDVSPATLDLWYDFFMGDAGRSMRRISNLVRTPWKDEPVEVNDVPIFRRVLGETDRRYTATTFYANLRELDRVSQWVKHYRDEKDREGLRAFTAQNRKAIAFAQQTDSIRRRVNRLREAGQTDRAEAFMRQINTRYRRVMEVDR